MRNQLGIAMSDEAMAAGFQGMAQLGVIEKLAVVNDSNATVFVEDGLPAIRQADDAEPAGGKAQPGPVQESILIGPAVDDGGRHALDHTLWDGPSSGQIHHSGD